MEGIIKKIKERQLDLNVFIEETCAKLEEAQKVTAKFLDLCLESDIKLVSVCRRTKKVPQSEKFGFGVYGSVFTMENARDKTGFPAIWGVVEKAGIGFGCGNTAQHQIHTDKIIEGVYEFKDRKWRKIEN